MIRIFGVQLLAHVEATTKVMFTFFVEFTTSPIPMDGSNPKFLEIQIFKPLDRIFHASKTLIDEVINQTKVIEKEVEQTQR